MKTAGETAARSRAWVVLVWAGVWSLLIKAASRCKTLRIYIKAVLELDKVLSDKFGS